MASLNDGLGYGNTIKLFFPPIAFGHGVHVGFREDWGRILELWAGKAISQSRMNCYGSLEDRNAERHTDNGDLACEVSEGSKDSARAIHEIHCN